MNTTTTQPRNKKSFLEELRELKDDIKGCFGTQRKPKTEFERKVSEVTEWIPRLIPRTGQYPMIIRNQLGRTLGYTPSWDVMDVAYAKLYQEHIVNPEQNLPRTMLKRCYKT